MVSEEHHQKTVEPANEGDVEPLYKFLEGVRERTGNALRVRSKEEIQNTIGNFVTIKEDGKIIACGEIFQTENTFTLELGALAVDEKYKGNGLSDTIIDYAENLAKKERQYLIIVTNNTTLQDKLGERGYQLSPIRYSWRKEKSPTKNVYVKYS